MATAPGDDDRVLTLLRSVWRVDHGLQSMSKRMETRRGVTGPQRLVLRTIQRRPGISAGDLADELSLHPSTLTGILRRLEQRGRIARKVDPTDRRRALFQLTEAGRALADQREGTVEEIVAALVAAVDPQALQVTARVLGDLAEALERAVEGDRDPTPSDA